jgi:hypothetical protein
MFHAAPRASGMGISAQLMLLQLALWISVVALLIDRVEAHQTAILVSALVGFVLVLNDLRETARGTPELGRLMLNFGVFYWFWLGALHLAFSNPPFPSPDVGYRYFFGVVPSGVVGTGIVCVNLFAFCALAGWRYAPIPRRLTAALADRNDPAPDWLVDALCFFLALIAWVPTLVANGGSLGAAMNSLLMMRAGEATKQDLGLLHHLYLVGFAGGAFAIARLVLWLPGNMPLRVTTSVIMLVLVFLLEGSRFNLGFLIVPGVLLLLLPTRDPALGRRRRARAGLLGIAAILLVLVQGAVRTTGLLETEPRTEETSFVDTLERGFFGHDHFGAALIAIDVIGTRGDYFYEPMLPFFFTHYVPRSIWPGKPAMISWTTYNEEVTQGRAFNVTPSVVGQYYMNWSYFGVASVGLFFGWFAALSQFWVSRVDLRRQTISALIAGLMLCFVLLSFRMLHPLYASYPLFAFVIYLTVCRRGRRPRVGVVRRRVAAGRMTAGPAVARRLDDAVTAGHGEPAE